MWKVLKASLSVYAPKVKDEGIEGACRHDQPTYDPSLADVMSLLDQVDGRNCSEMSIEGTDECIMLIGGGADRFIVTIVTKHSGTFQLLGPDPSKDTTRITFGGVLSDMPRCYIASKTETKTSLGYFIGHGGPDPSLNWEVS